MRMQLSICWPWAGYQTPYGVSRLLCTGEFQRIFDHSGKNADPGYLHPKGRQGGEAKTE
jgi:hypothetical protein